MVQPTLPEFDILGIDAALRKIMAQTDGRSVSYAAIERKIDRVLRKNPDCFPIIAKQVLSFLAYTAEVKPGGGAHLFAFNFLKDMAGTARNKWRNFERQIAKTGIEKENPWTKIKDAGIKLLEDIAPFQPDFSVIAAPPLAKDLPQDQPVKPAVETPPAPPVEQSKIPSMPHLRYFLARLKYYSSPKEAKL